MNLTHFYDSFLLFPSYGIEKKIKVVLRGAVSHNLFVDNRCLHLFFQCARLHLFLINYEGCLEWGDLERFVDLPPSSLSNGGKDKMPSRIVWGGGIKNFTIVA